MCLCDCDVRKEQEYVVTCTSQFTPLVSDIESLSVVRESGVRRWTMVEMRINQPIHAVWDSSLGRVDDGEYRLTIARVGTAILHRHGRAMGERR